MGSFSWNKADNLTQTENIVQNSLFKFLIPKKFGGGFIKDYYQDYGYLAKDDNNQPKYDMYELLAFWNEPTLVKYDEKEIPKMKTIDKYTEYNRGIGIDIGCYDKDILKLKYPLKLVSPSCNLTYEEIDNPSLGDPDQGFFSRKRN